MIAIRRILIVTNYIALVFLVISAFMGVMITRGQGFEVHFALSLVSLVFSMFSHVGSGAYFVLRPFQGKTRIPVIILDYISAGFYMWITYAGFMIRQGVSFDYHFTISIMGFFIAVAANVSSALFLATKYETQDTD